jgi:TonB family protein
MTRRSIVMFLLLTLLGASPAFPQQASQSPAATHAPAEGLPTYPNTAQGLERQMKDMLKLAKHNKNPQALAAYAKSLVLPDADNWFNSVFGDARGPAFAAASERERSQIELSAPDTLASLQKQDLTYVEAVRFDDSCNDRASATEYPFLLLRQRPEPLYDVRFTDDQDGEFVWAYFAYVDGAFRYIGSLQKKRAKTSYERGAPQPVDDSSTTEPAADAENENMDVVHVAQKAQQEKLIHQELPDYPRAAKSHGIAGEVILHAIIAKDGSVRDLDLNEGACALAVPAMNAVKKWRYKPTLVKGEPVEVETTISVEFTLGNPHTGH